MAVGAGAVHLPEGMSPAEFYIGLMIASNGAVKGCSRCGQDHESLVWKRFETPVKVSETESFVIWAMCPVSRDPMMVALQVPIEGTATSGD